MVISFVEVVFRATPNNMMKQILNISHTHGVFIPFLHMHTLWFMIPPALSLIVIALPSRQKFYMYNVFIFSGKPMTEKERRNLLLLWERFTTS